MTIELKAPEVPAPIAGWFEALEPAALAEVAAASEETAVFSSDLVVGFCTEGNLASPRIGALAEPVADLFLRAHTLGVRDFVLLQDTHDPDAAEFGAFPPHCVRGTPESQTVPALAGLPFAGSFTILEKNTLDPSLGTTLGPWLDDHRTLRTAIVVGDCTDLCVYQLATHLRQRANAVGTRGFRVIVPADCVDTYDFPEDAARAAGAMAHAGDFFHLVFLYHLALTGVEVVRELK